MNLNPKPGRGGSPDPHSKKVKYETFGIMAMDALHIACAEFGKADFLVTCDDFLVRKGNALKGELKVRIVNLMEFVAREVFKI